eukprot:4704840-Pyramimonas_sp.AAC.1
MAGILFTLSADCQFTPHQLQASGWVDGIGGVVVASGQEAVAPSERFVDCFAMSPFLAVGAQVEVNADVAISPHRPVRLRLNVPRRPPDVRPVFQA